MKFILILLVAIFIFSNFILAEENSFNTDELVIKFKSENRLESYFFNNYRIKDFDLLNKKYDVLKIDLTGNRKLNNTYLLKFSQPILKVNRDKVISTYMETGLFEYVEPNYIGRGSGVMGELETFPNEPLFSRQYGLYNDGTFTNSTAVVDADTDMELAWDIEKGDSSIIVAVLDAGLRLNHPEFQGRLWNNKLEIVNGKDDDGNGYIDDIYGWNFAYEDNNPTDDQGHGTNVTGIIGANPDNGIGYAGVDWRCKIMVGKILNNQNSGSYLWFAEGIYYAVDNGARVINMSVGGSGNSKALEDAVNYAYENGVIIVACMMNENNIVTYYPAGYKNTIAVGSTDPNDERSSPFPWRATSGSNYGQHIDVVAPGNYIYGLSYNSDNNYNTYWSGTSQATPLVAGICSLLLSQDPDRNPDEIRAILRETAEDRVGRSNEDTPGFDIYHGYGRVNAYRALTYSKSEVENKTNQAEISIYPNPTNHFIKIETEVLIEKIRIYDMLGQEMRLSTNQTSNSPYKIDISHLQQGLYIINCFNNKNNIIFSKSFIKE